MRISNALHALHGHVVRHSRAFFSSSSLWDFLRGPYRYHIDFMLRSQLENELARSLGIL
jgi:hypothetical protein